MTETHIDIGMMPSHPGALLREDILRPHNLNITKAAQILGVRRATLSDLLHEKSALSAEMALRIEKAFGVNMEMMLGVQMAWDIATTRQRENDLDIERFEPEAMTL